MEKYGEVEMRTFFEDGASEVSVKTFYNIDDAIIYAKKWKEVNIGAVNVYEVTKKTINF